MKKLCILLCLIGVTACTTAGPFVSNISYDGQGNLVVEKQYIQHNEFMGTVSAKPASTSIIHIGTNK